MLNAMIPLALGMLFSYLLGVYKNVSIFGFKFEWKKAIDGLIKGAIIVGSFYTLAYMIDVLVINGVDVSDVVSPTWILLAGNVLYATKIATKLVQIVGVKDMVLGYNVIEEPVVEEPEEDIDTIEIK